MLESATQYLVAVHIFLSPLNIYLFLLGPLQSPSHLYCQGLLVGLQCLVYEKLVVRLSRNICWCYQMLSFYLLSFLPRLLYQLAHTVLCYASMYSVIVLTILCMLTTHVLKFASSGTGDICHH